MSEILREDINIEGILLGLKKDELSKSVPYKIMSPTFVLQQVLAPWWWGKKIDLTLNDVIKGIAFGFAQIPYIIRNYKDYKRPKTFGELDNYSIFEFLDRANTNDFSRSEVSSGGIMANARGKYFFEKLKLKNTQICFYTKFFFKVLLNWPQSWPTKEGI